MLARILIIDDEEKLRQLLARIIRLEGFEVMEAGTAQAGLQLLESGDIDVALVDVRLPDARGIDWIKSTKERFSEVEFILLTAYGTIADGVQAMKNGAFDYLTKGDDNNRILPVLYRATEKAALTRKVRQLEKQLTGIRGFDRIVGHSEVIQLAIQAARKVAPTQATVLLLGETGTGKEVFARAIHSESPRRNHPFVAVNCAAISRELLENELFGHKAGAFTGAQKDARGILVEAHQGTVFFDEIGEMALDLQAKLLRVLETREFFRIGDSKPTKVDLRIIAATNRQLLQEVANGNFREDLYYRLSVFQIQLPPLRDRPEDITLLATQFLQELAPKSGLKVPSLAPSFLQALERHPWKGNVRELRNILERSLILLSGDTLTVDTLPADFAQYDGDAQKEHEALNLASLEKIHIQRILKLTAGNKTEAARLLGIALTTLYRKLEAYRIEG